eukprot:1162009-Pelagomonas_calceolata.AAC.5
MAAIHDETADAAIGNITSSNSANVFLGLGLPWIIAAGYFYNRVSSLNRATGVCLLYRWRWIIATRFFHSRAVSCPQKAGASLQEVGAYSASTYGGGLLHAKGRSIISRSKQAPATVELALPA